MLEIRDLSKRYGETLALEGAAGSFRAGTIHTILGENGSGKSTLVKMLSGIVVPDRGTITIDGRVLDRFEPAHVQSLGLATVFQEVLVAPDRDVVSNVLLGTDRLFSRGIPRRERRHLVERTLARFTRTPVPLDLPVGGLPLATLQLVVLARAVVREPRILILDEVTAALDFADREAVFTMMEAFARAGGLILFISHRMDEVLRLSDAVTVLRNGRVVETLGRAEVTSERLLRLMAPEAVLGRGRRADA
jgi:ribose transport system ATP-binding protein